MTDMPLHIERLINWGNWSKVQTGAPLGLPDESNYCRGALKSKWNDEGWAEFDQNGLPIDRGAPEAPRFFIHEKDAMATDEIIKAMTFHHRYLLRDKYCKAPQVFKFRRYDDETAWIESAELAFSRLVKDFPTGKQKVMEMISQQWRTGDIVKFAKVSRQYVARMKKAMNVN